MRIGISLTSAYTVDDPREGARRMIDRAAAARSAGLDSLFVGDHHATGPGTYYQNVPIMGRLIAEWGDGPVGALFLLPLWHPVLLAEQVATLASIARGRFIMQCAIGRDDAQFTGMGVNAKFRPSLFEETLDIVRRLWAGETVDANHRHRFTGACIGPLPPEPIDVWVGASASGAIDRAARLGDGWIADPTYGTKELAAQSAEYLERAQAYGRPPKAVTVRRNVYVGATDEAAAAVVDPVLAQFSGDRMTLLYGSPETVASRIRELARLGFTDVLVRSLVPDHRETLRSLERLAEVRERVADA